MHRLSLKPALASALAVLLFTACGEDEINNADDHEFFAEEPLSFSIGLEAQTEFVLEAINGSVEVTGDQHASSISVSGVRRVVSDSQEDADAHLPLLGVIVDSSSVTEAVVLTDQPAHAEGRDYIVNCVIAVPQDLAIKVGNINGNITVESIEADAVIESINGRIFATDIEGNAAMTVINGQISASVTLPPGGELDVGVTNGLIDLQLPQDTSAEFSATVVNGSVSVTGLSLSDQSTTPQSMTGTLGSGDGTIIVHAVNGTIVVRGL